MIDDIQTIPEDWSLDAGMTLSEQEATARYTARQRLSPPLTESAAESEAILFGDPPPAPKAAEETLPTRTLDLLLEEVNQALAEAGLEQYADLGAVKTALRAQGFKSYLPANHATMRLKLISCKEPNGKDHTHDPA